MPLSGTNIIFIKTRPGKLVGRDRAVLPWPVPQTLSREVIVNDVLAGGLSQPQLAKQTKRLAAVSIEDVRMAGKWHTSAIFGERKFYFITDLYWQLFLKLPGNEDLEILSRQGGPALAGAPFFLAQDDFLLSTLIYNAISLDYNCCLGLALRGRHKNNWLYGLAHVSFVRKRFIWQVVERLMAAGLSGIEGLVWYRQDNASWAEKLAARFASADGVAKLSLLPSHLRYRRDLLTERRASVFLSRDGIRLETFYTPDYEKPEEKQRKEFQRVELFPW